MIYKTYHEWDVAGYYVRKGEKAKWINGKPVFCKAQVVERHPSGGRRRRYIGDNHLYGDSVDAGGVGFGMGADFNKYF